MVPHGIILMFHRIMFRVIGWIVPSGPTPVNEFNSMLRQNGNDRMSLRPTRQTVAFTGFLAAFLLNAWANFAVAQINDTLDSYPPRWNLVSSDCKAEVVEHTNRPTGGVGDSGYESMQLNCGHGTEAVVEYRIEPSRMIDELTATAFLRSNHKGQRIGLRVRFPYLTDPQTRQSVSVVIYGTDYRDSGQWQRIGIGAITGPLRMKIVALRREYGSTANLDDAFVDAIVLNVYTGAGSTQTSIDNVSVAGIVAATSNASLFSNAQSSARVPVTGPAQTTTAAIGILTALPPNRVTRILQHQGEPLDWVRTLGFDAVLLNQPANERILREAMLARIAVFAPPPSSPDISLDSLLEPLAGYYLGTSLNEASIESTKETADRLRRLPTRWQRGLIVAPAESWRDYAAMADSIVHDLPSPIRGLGADEEIASLADRTSRMGRVMPLIIGIQSDPPPAMTSQLDSIATSIGAPRGDDVPWHAMHLQVVRALHSAPRAILFRSHRSLTSGTPEDQRRSMALSYINRYLETVGPVVGGSTSADSLACEGARYRCSQLQFPGGKLLVASSTAQHRGLTLAGDGNTLRIKVAPADAIKLAWRLTHFSAERISVQNDTQDAHVEIISPDTVETIILSSDPAMGGRIAGVVKRVASQASLDRWQLTRESLDQLSVDWQAATGSRVVSTNRASIDLLNAAESTLRNAEPIFRSGDPSSAIRMARRADAWQMKSRWNLHSALSPDGQLSSTTSTPPLLSTGGVATQLMWWPLMSDQGWSENRMLHGSLDDPAMVGGPGGWSIGFRSEGRTTNATRIESGRQVEGAGCLIANVSSINNSQLPGGYAGTTMQIRSPSVRFAAGVPVRIDAKIRTLGFGGADQGVLVHDSIGGAELGVLVRATPTWQPLRLYRQTLEDGDVRVMFETIGAGEVMIDDVQIHAWEPASSETLPLRRIAENTTDQPRTE